MKHPARWIALVVAVVVVVFGVVLAVNVGNDPQATRKQSPFLGKAVPDFDLPDARRRHGVERRRPPGRR